MVYRLECVYRMADSQTAAAGRQFVEANCSVPVIASQWEDILFQAIGGGKRRYGPPAKLPEGYVVA